MSWSSTPNLTTITTRGSTTSDIDRAAIVWARKVDPLRMAPLLHYYRDRTVWLVKVRDDEDVPELEPYRPAGD